jgi:hypothetical protein
MFVDYEKGFRVTCAEKICIEPQADEKQGESQNE